MGAFGASTIVVLTQARMLAIGTFERSIEEQVGAGQCAGAIDLLVGIVTRSVAARREDHDGWRKLGHCVRIVAGLAQHLAIGQPELTRRVLNSYCSHVST